VTAHRQQLALKVKQAAREMSELCANDYFLAQSGRAENDGFVNLRFGNNSLTTAAVACLMVNLNGEPAYRPVQTQFHLLSHF
jgi:hypothetical protein